MNETRSHLLQLPNQLDPYGLMLSESIERFFDEYRKGVTDFSSFIPIFSRLLRNLPDPPVAVVWFYSALTFHTAKSSARGSSEKLQAVKDLFQLLVSCTESSCASKRIAVLAPVVYCLFDLVVEKKTSKEEAENLIDGVVSYISICCGQESEEVGCSLGFGPYFLDLARVWMVDKPGEDLKGFLPLVSHEICQGISINGGVGYFAGIVMFEAFLLRLCLKFSSRMSMVELQNELHSRAVQMIAGFRSCHFYDIFLRMLLQSVLPTTYLLGSADEILLREVLYDAAIIPEYPFLKLQFGTERPAADLRTICLNWLFVADNGIRSFRDTGNLSKAMSYINAFRNSCWPSQLINWIRNQPGFSERMSQPNICTPTALIEWLLVLEDQGVRVFDHSNSKLRARETICKSEAEFVQPAKVSDGMNLDVKFFNNASNVMDEDPSVGDFDMVDSMATAAVQATSITLNGNGIENGRKRKECMTDKEDMRVKFLRQHLHDNPLREKSLPLV
ncbi:uncharacterized protein LOC101207241 [Cucumis sativus]|uniref:Uncharacterized protein n=1 Tax=Cucumis sativus TaxID=3659 RepID=A0A0A0L0N4_CUCSA|nr:uncharacterized protein LOC101207241 [Cucumis sativus]KGN55323.1 hypothetical protein Csa_012589 [Cucumis sativus]